MILISILINELNNMKKNNENSLFSFIPETSSIIYKKINSLTPDIKSLNEKIKPKNIPFKPSFFYDKYTNQFLYINGEDVIILDTKFEIKTFSRINVNEKVKSISIEYNNKYILYTTYNYKSIIINLLDLEAIECFENKKAQYLGGFFIPYKNPQKEHDYFILCMVSRKYFNISRIKMSNDQHNELQYMSNKPFVSNNMKIIDYNFNHIFKLLLIIRDDPYSFCFYNLKSKCTYKTPIILNNIKIIEKESKLYLENIYKKLYLIHLLDSVIEVYRLNDLKEIKEPLKINYNINKNKVNIKYIFLQFYNSLIFIYMENFIKIYDIKSKNNNYEIFNLKITKDQFYDTFYKARIVGKYLLINDIFYKIKFDKLNYKNNSYSNIKDSFFLILRRNNCINALKRILIEILNNFQFSIFLEIIEGIVLNNKKYIENISKKENNININCKNEPYKVIYIGNNNFFVSEDFLFEIFNQNFTANISPDILIKILSYFYYIYNSNNIYLDIDLFYSSLFCQLNKIDNFYLIENLIKNRMIPINEKLGVYLIMRAKRFKDIYQYNYCYRIGIDILLSENKIDDNIIKNIIEDFLKINKFSDTFNLIADTYFQKTIDDIQQSEIK